MVASAQNNAGNRCYHEPLDPGGDRSSVRLLFDLTALFNTYVLEYFSALLFPDRKFTNDSINEIFDQLGPTPRLCLDYQYIPDGLAAYRRDLTTAIAEATPSKIEGLLMAAESLSMDSISQKNCLVRRAKQDEVASCHYPHRSIKIG